MGNFKSNYPTVGTSALKPSEDPIAHASAVIVKFPGSERGLNVAYSDAKLSIDLVHKAKNLILHGQASGKEFDVGSYQSAAGAVALALFLILAAILTI